jgi:hypothetical protein
LPNEVIGDNNDIVEIGGRWMRDVDLSLDPEWVERIRTGYMCIECFEPAEHAWPDRCRMCGFRIEGDQAAEYARRYLGNDGAQATYDRLRRLGVYLPGSA